VLLVNSCLGHHCDPGVMVVHAWLSLCILYYYLLLNASFELRVHAARDPIEMKLCTRIGVHSIRSRVFMDLKMRVDDSRIPVDDCSFSVKEHQSKTLMTSCVIHFRYILSRKDAK
jgi:hypothetical protein